MTTKNKINTKTLLTQLKNRKFEKHEDPDILKMVDRIILTFNNFKTIKENLNEITEDYDSNVNTNTLNSIIVRNQYHNLVLESFKNKKRKIKFKVSLKKHK